MDLSPVLPDEIPPVIGRPYERTDLLTIPAVEPQNPAAGQSLKFFPIAGSIDLWDASN